MKIRFGFVDLIIATILIFSALICVTPFIHLLAVSLSNNVVAQSGRVGLLPVGFNLAAYEYTLKQPMFWRSVNTTVVRTVLSCAISIPLIIITAYPLSKESSQLKGRTIVAWYFFITMLFQGGLIPTYVVINQLGLMNTIWALVLPGCMNVFNLILMLNFFRQVPKEIEEAALIDGAKQWRILWQLFVPVSMPSVATVLLFTAVASWNAWFDGLIYMNSPERYPLQSYLQTVVIAQDTTAMNIEQLDQMSKLSKLTIDAAQIFIAAFPMLCLYPFLQRYFVKGLIVGSVKG